MVKTSAQKYFVEQLCDQTNQHYDAHDVLKIMFHVSVDYEKVVILLVWKTAILQIKMIMQLPLNLTISQHFCTYLQVCSNNTMGIGIVACADFS